MAALNHKPTSGKHACAVTYHQIQTAPRNRRPSKITRSPPGGPDQDVRGGDWRVGVRHRLKIYIGVRLWPPTKGYGTPSIRHEGGNADQAPLDA
ncbi:hypothetical protein MTP99_017570 [Tenebrio molitor]|jgi:hypothetical protein|nr:hypothetical protein MTP99_017570 [Tenebrio molitor]